MNYLIDVYISHITSIVPNSYKLRIMLICLESIAFVRNKRAHASNVRLAVKVRDLTSCLTGMGNWTLTRWPGLPLLCLFKSIVTVLAQYIPH